LVGEGVRVIGRRKDIGWMNYVRRVGEGRFGQGIV